MPSTAESNWGELDPQAITQIKAHMRQAVADGISEALRSGGIRDAIAEGMTLGIQQAAMDEDLFDLLTSRAAKGLHRSLVTNTGALVLSGAVRVFRVLSWACLSALAIYSLFGWAGITAAWAYIRSGGLPP